MRYKVVTETYSPGGVYPVATMPSELSLPDKDIRAMRETFSQYGGMLDSHPRKEGKRSWTYRKTTGTYVHLTTITEA